MCSYSTLLLMLNTDSMIPFFEHIQNQMQQFIRPVSKAEGTGRNAFRGVGDADIEDHGNGVSCLPKVF